jgi:hypothetical protein
MEVGSGGIPLGSGGGMNGGALKAGHWLVSTLTLQSRGNEYAFVAFTEGFVSSCAINWHRHWGDIAFTLLIPLQQTSLGVGAGPVT